MKLDETFLDDDLKHLHEKTLDIIINKGIQIKDDGVINRLEKRAVLCDLSEQMVRFSPELVADAIQKASAEVKLGAPDPEYILNFITDTRREFMSSGTGAFAIEGKPHKRRSSTEADVVPSDSLI